MIRRLYAGFSRTEVRCSWKKTSVTSFPAEMPQKGIRMYSLAGYPKCEIGTYHSACRRERCDRQDGTSETWSHRRRSRQSQSRDPPRYCAKSSQILRTTLVPNTSAPIGTPGSRLGERTLATSASVKVGFAAILGYTTRTRSLKEDKRRAPAYDTSATFTQAVDPAN